MKVRLNKLLFYGSILLLSVPPILSCEGDITPDPALAGEWAYVEDFNHNLTQSCQACAGFDPDTASKVITFYPDRSMKGKVSRMEMTGFYVSSETIPQSGGSSGSLRVSRFWQQNDARPGEADQLLVDRIRSAQVYSTGTMSSGGEPFLIIRYNDIGSLYFVKKK